MHFHYDKDIEDMIKGCIDDLFKISEIPTLEISKNVFWQMVSADEEREAIKHAEYFFEKTFSKIYKTDITATIIRFKWKMTNMRESEDILVYFLIPPDELRKKLNSLFKMKAFW